MLIYPLIILYLIVLGLFYIPLSQNQFGLIVTVSTRRLSNVGLQNILQYTENHTPCTQQSLSIWFIGGKWYGHSVGRHPTGSMFWLETWHSAISQMANFINLNSVYCQNFRNHEHLCTWNLQWLKSIHFTTLGPFANLTSVCIFYPVSRIHATSHTCIYKPVETGFIVH